MADGQASLEAAEQREGRREAVSGHKRALILKAAREVFEAEGLEGASLRAIAGRAGYTPAALYFHFDSKEAIYAEVLRASLTALGQAVDQAVRTARKPESRFRFIQENAEFALADLDV